MKPVLIGENNPISLRSGYELYPLPVGCSGQRLWVMLNEAHQRAHEGKYLMPSWYIERFDRRNLVVGHTFDLQKAKTRVREFKAELFGSGRRVVLLGKRVQGAFGLSLQPLEMIRADGCEWYAVPHPSGRNTWYNDARHAAAVGNLLLRLYEEEKTDAVA